MIAIGFRQWWIGLLVAAVVLSGAALLLRRWRHPQSAAWPGGEAVANASLAMESPVFAKALRRYRLLTAVELAALAALALTAVALTMRPLSARSLERSTMSRDVMLCLDVSGSMKELDENILRRFVELAHGLPGDRIGLTIWNGAAITVFPLTDDDRYVDGMLEFAVDQLNRGAHSFTLGTEEGGASLIGDGLTSCLQRFDRPDEERARSVVLATDNKLAGDPLMSITAAAQLASSRGVRIYAIAPENYITTEDADELKSVTASTGGAYFTTDDDRVVDSVINGIVETEATHLDQPPDVVHDDRPAPLVVTFLVGTALLGVLGWILRR